MGFHGPGPGRPRLAESRTYLAGKIDDEVAVPFLRWAKERGLNKSEALTLAIANLVGIPRDRQEVLPLTNS